MEKTLVHESLVLVRTFTVVPKKVWRAWIKPDALRVWFGQSGAAGWKAELDVRVGGRYHLVMQHPRGSYYDVRGEYREVVPDRRLVFTWEQRGSDLAEGQALVSVDLRPAAGGTELRFMLEPMFDPTARAAWEADFRRLARMLQPKD
jgi:uncharacterized protein YndB with AHSA1/START domain